MTARDHLAALDVARASVTARAVTPVWYHPALGVLVAVLVGSQLLGEPWRVLVLVGYFAGLALLVHGYRQRTGVWVSSSSLPGATRFVVPLVVLVLACVAVGFAARADRLPTWTVAVAAAVAGVSVLVVGRRFDRSWRAWTTRGPGLDR